MNVGNYRHSVLIKQIASHTKDTGGGYTDNVADVGEWWCSIQSATAGAMERLSPAGAIATCSHIFEGRHHDGLTTRCQLILGSRTFNVRGVHNVHEADETTRVFAEEVVE